MVFLGFREAVVSIVYTSSLRLKKRRHCRTNFTYGCDVISPYRFIRKHLSRIYLKCPFNGCHEISDYENFPTHISNCECRAAGEAELDTEKLECDDKGNSIHFYKNQCLTLRTLVLENDTSENEIMKKVLALKLERDSIADELFRVKFNLKNITIGDHVVALWGCSQWQYFTATIVSFDRKTLLYTIEWDDKDPTGRHVHYTDIALDQVRVLPGINTRSSNISNNSYKL